MYNKQQIAYLLKNGFTLDEIMQTDGVQAHEEQPAPAPAPAPAPQNEILAAIEKLSNTIQAGNIRAGGFPAPDGGITADQVLANIINPPGYTGKEK